jgi:hypothetical protein
MNRGHDDGSIRFVRWWVRRYTAGLLDHDGASLRAEIDRDLAEHAQYREEDGWAPKQITLERLGRLAGGVFADLSWRHELISGQCQVRGVVRVSVLSVTSIAALTLALFHFAFAAYLLGTTSLAEQRFLRGLDYYGDVVGRPVASVVAALIIGGLGVVLLAAGIARPVSTVIANIATIAIASVAVLFFWLGVWPIGIVAVLGSTLDIATRAPNPAPQQ